MNTAETEVAAGAGTVIGTDNNGAGAVAPSPAIAAMLEDLVNQTAAAIDNRLKGLEQIAAAGGPYAQSRTITYRKALHEAAVDVIQLIVNYAPLRPNSS